VRVSIDPGGVVAAASHADGSVRLTHVETGRVLWKAWGHGEMAAAAHVSPDLARLISVSGDGCMFIWRLPEALSEEIKAAAARVAAVRAPGAAAIATPASEARPRPAPRLTGARATCEAAGPADLSAARRTLLGLDAGDAEPGAGSSAAAERTPEAVRFSSAGSQTDPDLTGVSASTPGSAPPSAGPGSVGQTIKRVKAGRPLVPKALLPRWAASKVSPSPSPTKQPAARAFEEADAGAGAGAGASAGAEVAAASEAGGAAPAVGGKWAKTARRGASLFEDEAVQVGARGSGCGRVVCVWQCGGGLGLIFCPGAWRGGGSGLGSKTL
jgi:WD40 repeat protein